MFKVIKFSRCGAVLALMLVAALAIGITSAILFRVLRLPQPTTV